MIPLRADSFLSSEASFCAKDIYIYHTSTILLIEKQLVASGEINAQVAHLQ